MPLTLLFQLSVRNLFRHRRRNLLMIAAIAGAIAGTAVGNALIRGMQVDLLDNVVKYLTGHLQIQTPGYQDNPEIEQSFTPDTQWQQVLVPGELAGYAPRIRVPAVILSERETRGIELVGVDPARENISFFGDVVIEGERLAAADDRRLIIGRELADQLKTRIGRRLVIMTLGLDGKNREAGFRIAGIFNTDSKGMEKSMVFTGLAGLQNLLDGAVVTEISLLLESRESVPSAVARLSQALPSLKVSSWMELQPQAASLFSLVNALIWIFFAVFMGALAFGLMNALITAVMERIRELGMLRAVGMRPRAVIVQVVIESMLLMLAGIVIGLLLGAFFIYLLRDGIDLTRFADGVEMVGLGNQMVPVFLLTDVVQLALMSIALGFIASLYPAWRAVRLRPLEAIGR